MIPKILNGLMLDRHRFQRMTFSELSELYTSMMLRSLATGMAGIFIPIYLYQAGYEVWQILLFYAVAFGVQSVFVVPIAKLIGAIGPKHVILISFFVQAVSLLGLVNLDLIHDQYLVVGSIYGLANSAFFMAFHIDFSKVKHRKSGGREVGWAYILERSGAVMGPILGGAVAYLFGAEYTFALAIVISLLAAIPLFMTSEPIKIHQKPDFRHFKPSTIKLDIASYSAMTISMVASLVVWPLFVSVIVFEDNAYIQLGSITSISILISVISARTIGRIVDNKKGRSLLRFNAWLGGALNLFRPFTSGYPMALALNLANDGVTPGYRMPYLKGMYDAADDHPGFRIVYIAILEFFATIARSLFFAIAALAAFFIEPNRGFFVLVFALCSIATILVTLERYPALNPRRRTVHAAKK